MIEHCVNDDQEELTINNDTFVADSDMVSLLKELNKAGLETTQHCSGHGEREAYLSIKLKPGMDVAVRTESDGSRLVIWWDK